MRILFLSVIVGTALADTCALTHGEVLGDSSGPATCPDPKYENTGVCTGAQDADGAINPQPVTEAACTSGNTVDGSWNTDAETGGNEQSHYEAVCCTACTPVANADGGSTLECDSATNSEIAGASADACADGFYHVEAADNTDGDADLCNACTVVPWAVSGATYTCTVTTDSRASACGAGYYLTTGGDVSTMDTCTPCVVVANAVAGAAYTCSSDSTSAISSSPACADGYYYTAGTPSTCTACTVLDSCTNAQYQACVTSNSVCTSLSGEVGDCSGSQYFDEQSLDGLATKNHACVARTVCGSCAVSTDAADDDPMDLNHADCVTANTNKDHTECAAVVGIAGYNDAGAWVVGQKDGAVICTATHWCTVSSDSTDGDGSCDAAKTQELCEAVEDASDAAVSRCEWNGDYSVTLATTTTDTVCAGGAADASSEDAGGLSGGAIAGIIIGCVVAIAVIGVVIWWCSRGSGDAN